MDNDELLGISEASKFLGVSEAALRQWTDEQKVVAFVTPGGHRRYARQDLASFMSSHKKLLGVRDLASYIEASAPLHRQLDASLAQTVPNYIPEADTHAQFAALGRQILTLIKTYATETTHREESLEEIKKVGTSLGLLTASHGMSLTDAVHTFIQHRDPLMKAAAEMMKKGEGVQRRVADAIPLVDQAMDAALVALVDSYRKDKSAK